MSGSAQQTAYNLELSAPTQPGHVADSAPRRIRPFRNDNVAAFPFGLAVCRSANADLRGFDALVTTRQFLGVTTWGQSQESGFPVGTANDGIQPTEMNGILEQGEVLVTVTEAVTPESAVRVQIVDGTPGITGAVVGSFCTTADTSTHTTALLVNAKYITSAAPLGQAKVLLHGPAPVKLVAD